MSQPGSLIAVVSVRLANVIRYIDRMAPNFDLR